MNQGHGYPRDMGPTSLAIAVRSGRVETARELLSLGADIDARSTAGHTPLLVAVFADQPEMVKLLLAAGADPTAAARCVRGCSKGEGSALTVAEWVVELERTRLRDLLAVP